MALKFVSKSTFTPEDIAVAPELEPALESLLRSLKVRDSVTTAMRVNEILDHSVLSDLAQDEAKMRKCAAAFGIDQSEDAEFRHRRKMAKLLRAWRQAKTQNQVKIGVDAAAKVQGEPIAMLAMDKNSLTVQFKAKFGSDLCEEDLPAHSCFEEFEERLSEGSREAEHLREVVSQEEAEIQRKNKPDLMRQQGMHLDGRLTLQTRRRFSSTVHRTAQGEKKVMENLWGSQDARFTKISQQAISRTFSNY